jgi:phosphoglycerate kinase
VVAATHFGRPKGSPDPDFDVAPIRERLNELLPGVELRENLRFHPGEELNDAGFGASLVEGIDFFVNEAFGASHRAHASIMVPPTLVPSAAGPNLMREVDTLLGALEAPVHPFVAIVGGAKVKDKLAIVQVLVDKADVVIIGGGMAYTFAAAQGRAIGDSLFDESHIASCERLLATGRVVIPDDSFALPSGTPFGNGGEIEPTLFSKDIPDGWSGLDIGPASARHFADLISSAGTVLWNGPMGVFEDSRLRSGTEVVARAVASCRGKTIVGGGDSVAAIQLFSLQNDVDFVSTGGGASLELVEFGDLPGLRALREGRQP